MDELQPVNCYCGWLRNKKHRSLILVIFTSSSLPTFYSSFPVPQFARVSHFDSLLLTAIVAGYGTRITEDILVIFTSSSLPTFYNPFPVPQTDLVAWHSYKGEWISNLGNLISLNNDVCFSGTHWVALLLWTFVELSVRIFVRVVEQG
jgi:hypothetical protein